jgi:hypothetical protein
MSRVFWLPLAPLLLGLVGVAPGDAREHHLVGRLQGEAFGEDPGQGRYAGQNWGLLLVLALFHWYSFNSNLLLIITKMAHPLQDKLETPVDENFPALQIQYTYPFAFQTVAEGFLKKYIWEMRTHLTTITQLEQVDPDNITFYRRCEPAISDVFGYEKVSINRTTQTITSEVIQPRPNGQTRLFERQVFEAQDGQVVQNNFVYDPSGLRTWKVEFFKQGVERLTKAIKFANWEKETQ